MLYQSNKNEPIVQKQLLAGHAPRQQSKAHGNGRQGEGEDERNSDRAAQALIGVLEITRDPRVARALLI